MVDIPQSRTLNRKLSSVVAYTPQSHLDFGSLLCWAMNDVGSQREPCVFQVVPAAPPEPAFNCSVWNNATAAGSVVVSCQAGWDGGLQQTFTLEIRKHSMGRVIAALRDYPSPHFTVTGLAPGTEYQMSIYASNSQGDAEPVSLIHLTPIDIAEKRLSADAAGGSQGPNGIFTVPVLAVILGLTGSLLLSCIVVIIVVRLRHTSANQNHPHTKLLYDKSSSQIANRDDGGFLQRKKDPDVILVNSGKNISYMLQLLRYKNKCLFLSVIEILIFILF